MNKPKEFDKEVIYYHDQLNIINMLIFQISNFIWDYSKRTWPHKTIFLPYIYFHQDRLPTNAIISRYHIRMVTTNYSISVKKSSHQYMSWPFGHCSTYQIPDERTYHGMSYIECYRNCLTHHSIKQWNCFPYLIDNFITEYQLNTNKTKMCSTKRDDVKNRRLKETIFVKRCSNICPKECIRVEYWSEVKMNERFFDNQKWIVSRFQFKTIERLIKWDSSQPMFAYIDEPVMTFTQYLVFCGGLMGLWFGHSIKDLFSVFIDKTFWLKICYNLLNVYEIIVQTILIILNVIGKIIFTLFDWLIIFFANSLHNCKNICIP